MLEEYKEQIKRLNGKEIEDNRRNDMKMNEWAKKEVEIYKKEESFTEEDFNYGNSCADSALKAFESLCEDGHSGMSIQITKIMLDRLIEGKPLTAIEDILENWSEPYQDTKEEIEKGIYQYNCKRMSGLFKTVYPDGKVEYLDVNRDRAVNINSGVTYGWGGATRLVNELFPIEFPYYPPTKPYRVYVEDFLTDPENGDFDTVGYFYIITPDGERVEVNKFIHYPDGDNAVEITREEYDKLKAKKVNPQ